ncbi:MAG: DUF835 domain-containing protein [Euryarchaeota archaeon]|nr:DUF835 domain-containing protein [Euryarchaeota archaeon]
MAINAIFPLITIGIAALFGAIVWRRNREDTASRVFLLLLVFFVLFALAYLPGRMGWHTDESRVLYRYGNGVLVPFMSATFLLFCLLFPRRVRFMNRRLFFVLPYIPALVLTSLFLQDIGLFATEVAVLEGAGFFYMKYGPLIPAYMAVAAVPALLAIGLWGRAYVRTGSSAERRALGALLAGVCTLTGFSIATGAGRMFAGIYLPVDENEAGIVTAAFFSFAILRYKIIITPTQEAVSPQPPRYSIEKGAYLFPDASSRRAHEIFGDLAKHGRPGLCLTRDHPGSVREQMGLAVTPIVWLGAEPPEKGIRTVNRLDDVANMVKDFIREAPDAVVLLDGAAYMVHRYEFQMYFWLVTTLKEVAGSGNAVLLVRTDPRVVSEKERAMLENELMAPPGVA